MTLRVIHIVAAAMADARGRIVLVRKRGTSTFMQPGGKREPGEDDLAALARELLEELGCIIDTGAARRLGVFSAPAANETDATVEAAVYLVPLPGPVAACGEIEELAWVDPADPGTLDLAPLTRDHVLPLMRKKGLAGRAGRSEFVIAAVRTGESRSCDR